MVTPEETVVDRLYQDFQALIASIDPSDLSLQTTVRVNFSKSLLMAVAGYFEEQVQVQIVDFVHNCTNGNKPLKEFVVRKAFGRLYSQLFNWKDNNANSFFVLFGVDLRESMKKLAEEQIEYDRAIKAFLEIGNARNELAHGNYADFPLDKTAEEIYESYKLALPFVETLAWHLEHFSAEQNS